MSNFIITVIFVIIPIISILIAAIIGLKRNIYQSSIKLLFTILAILVSAILTNSFALTIVNHMINNCGELLDNSVISYLHTTNSSKDIIAIIVALIKPTVFCVFFIASKFVFFLLNLVPGYLLSDKSIIRRKADRSNTSIIDTETVSLKTNTEENTVAQVKYAPYQSEKRKKISRSISVICCILSAFLVLASLSVPINAYTKYAEIVYQETYELVDMDADLEDVKNSVISLNDHPTNKCYTYTNNLLLRSFESFKNHKGTTVTTSSALSSALTILNSVSKWDRNSISSQNVYDLADLIECDPFSKDFVTAFVSELTDAWARGEVFLGMHSPDLNNPIMAAFLKELSAVDDITKVLRAAADVLKIKDILILTDGEFTVESTKQIVVQVFEIVNPDTVDIIKSMISEDVLTQSTELPPYAAGHISTFTGIVLDGIVDLKNNPDFSIEETMSMLENEAEALSAIVEMVSNPENAEPDKIVDYILESSVISNTIQEVTGNGALSDPYQIADSIPSGFSDKIKENLDKRGMSQNDEAYKSVLALFGI